MKCRYQVTWVVKTDDGYPIETGLYCRTDEEAKLTFDMMQKIGGISSLQIRYLNKNVQPPRRNLSTFAFF